MAESITLLLGTTKGAFLMDAGPTRTDWRLTGPHCGGCGINHVIGAPETGLIWAAGGGEWDGAGIWRSTDGGATWDMAKLAASTARAAWIDANPELAESWGMTQDPPAPFTDKLEALWSLGRAGGRLYAGGKPGLLFVSDDDGASWQEVPGINDFPGRDGWMPGAAGLTLHTIVADPETPAKLWVAISAAGVFASEDGGATWERRNRLANAASGGPGAQTETETGHCVHNAQRAPGTGDLLYQQNHHGVFRSGDGGRSWHDISAGLPSTFGFPIAVHPRDPQRIWVVPLNGDTLGRFPPDAVATVWTSGDGGESWSPQRRGLPGENCFFTVLRQAMAVDRASPAGVYFGTNSGSVFASADEGESWNEIARHLPTILSVEVMHRA